MTTSAAALGHAVREEVIRALSSPRVTEMLVTLRPERALVWWDELLSSTTISLVANDLMSDTGWRREAWVLDDQKEAHMVDEECFRNAAPNSRFSVNQCLRQPQPESLALRGLLSGVISKTTAAVLSGATGQVLKFCGADIARYGKGDYLRRHADDFGGRRLGFVWFFAPGWQSGDGGELVVEDISGRATVVQPIAGRVAALVLAQGTHHYVCEAANEHWTRYSVATHFSTGTVD